MFYFFKNSPLYLLNDPRVYILRKILISFTILWPSRQYIHTTRRHGDGVRPWIYFQQFLRVSSRKSFLQYILKNHLRYVDNIFLLVNTTNKLYNLALSKRIPYAILPLNSARMISSHFLMAWLTQHFHNHLIQKKPAKRKRSVYPI